MDSYAHSLSSAAELRRIRELQLELMDREQDPLLLYESLPNQEAFHKSPAQQRLVRKGNRAGGSVAAAVEFTRAALGLDPHGKFPTDRPLLMYVIGKGEGHIGRVFHRLLFRPGAIKLIRDLETGKWRAFRPQKDAGREGERRNARPLIPPRHIAEIAWGNRSERQFSVVRLKPRDPTWDCGTEIRAFSSGSDTSQAMGDPVDAIWIDEDLENADWVPEMQARLSDNKGRLWWAAYPWDGTEAIVTMSDAAAADVAYGSKDVAEFRLSFIENPHIDDEEKRRRRKDYGNLSDAEWAARNSGEFNRHTALMYPHFSRDFHCAPYLEVPGSKDHPFETALRSGGVPSDWTRYVGIDPGSATCAVAFAAIPPPDIGDYFLLYDELYIDDCTAEIFGEKMADRAAGQQFQAFIIDDHGSRSHEAGSGLTIAEQYARALREHGVRSVVTGHSFMPGSDDKIGRANRLRSWLRVRPDGTFKFRIIEKYVPHWFTEQPRYKRKKIERPGKGGDIYLEEADSKSRYSHLMNATEYLVAYGCPYVKPSPLQKPPCPSWLAWENFLAIGSHGNDQAIALGPRR